MSVVGRVQINRPGATGPVLPPTIPDDPPPGEGGSTYLDLITADGALAAWPLTENDGTNVYADVIGSLNGTIDKGTTADYAAAPIGPAVGHSPQLTGSGSLANTSGDVSITVPHDAIFEIGTADFSMEAWMLADAFDPSGAAYCPIGIVNGTLSNYVVALLLGPGYGAAAGEWMVADSNSIDDTRSPPAYDDQVLHHVVTTRRAGSYIFIVDGVEVANMPADPVVLNTDEVVVLAGIAYPGFPGYELYSLHGQLAWCAWYDVSLTTDQAAAHYAAGAP